MGRKNGTKREYCVGEMLYYLLMKTCFKEKVNIPFNSTFLPHSLRAFTRQLRRGMKRT
jgi:hypothetical protein